MKKFKKGLIALLTLTLLMGLLSACGGNEQEDKTASETPETNETPSTEDADGEENITLKFVSWQTNMQEEDLLVVEEYKKENPNIDVVFEYHGDQNANEYLKKVDLMVMGGDEMDILMTSNFPDFAKRATTNTYYPVNEFFEEEGVKATDVYSFAPEIDGNLYGIPGDWKSWFVLLNKDYLDEAGLDVPDLDWTWDDYREYASKLTQGEGASKRFGSYFHTWDTYTLMGLFSTRLDNPVVNPDETFNFDDPAFIEWNAFRKEMENEDKSSLSYADAKSMSANYRAMFFNGEVGMLPIGTWMIPEIDDQDKFPHDFVTTFAPLPKWSDEGVEGRSFTESHFYSVAASSKHPKEAYDFIRFFTTEGMKIRGTSISAEKDIDKMEAANNLITEPKYYDLEALESVLNNPKWEDNVFTFVPSYQKTLMTMVLEEAEKYLLDTITSEEMIETIKTRAEQIKADGQ